MNLEQEVAILRREMDEMRVTVQSLVSRTGEIETTLALIAQNITYIKEGQDQVQRTLSKVLWWGVSAPAGILITAFMTWVINGGLAS